MLAMVAGWWALRTQRATAAAEAIAVAEELISVGDIAKSFSAIHDLPSSVHDSIVSRLHEEIGAFDTLRTEPAGVRVSWRSLLEPTATWETLGETPLAAYLPRGRDGVLLRLELEGHTTRYLWSRAVRNRPPWRMQQLGNELSNALWVPRGNVVPGVLGGGMWAGDDRRVGDYLIDRYEVTNGEYKAFVDAGGYEDRAYWTDAFLDDSRRLIWEEAMARFVDRTGQPGPGTWEIGQYPDGMEDHPVAGLSWYEASAYARFVGRALPTMYHWYRAADVGRGHAVVPMSNFGPAGTAPVGEFEGITALGVSDMAGNVREWVQNAAGEYRMSQGGGWGDAPFAFALAQPLSPWDRSEQNGVRLITDLGAAELTAAASEPVAYYERDFAAEVPVSDEVFEVFRDLFAYEPRALNATVEVTDSDLISDVIYERVSLDAAYDGPRIILHVYRDAALEGHRLQPVVYFPGANALFAQAFNPATQVIRRRDIVARSGRMFVYPEYLSTFSRDDDFVYALQDETNQYRDEVVRWYQDLGRTLDYLEIRDDVDPDRFAYLGTSWGGRMGAIMLAVEPRFKAAVLNVAGLSPKPTQPSVDPFNFAPRIKAPVLMLSGQFDPIYPLELAARPLYRALGTPVKELYVAEGAHFVPYADEAQQVLSWFDTHLGPAG